MLVWWINKLSKRTFLRGPNYILLPIPILNSHTQLLGSEPEEPSKIKRNDKHISRYLIRNAFIITLGRY